MGCRASFSVHPTAAGRRLAGGSGGGTPSPGQTDRNPLVDQKPLSGMYNAWVPPLFVQARPDGRSTGLRPHDSGKAMSALKKLRKRIDQVDHSLLELLTRRARLVKDGGSIKEKNGHLSDCYTWV